jgi:hypothetical protein
MSYGISVRKYKNVTITLQKERENPLKLSFCFQTGDTSIIHDVTSNRSAISRSSSASKSVEIIWAEIYRGRLFF